MDRRKHFYDTSRIALLGMLLALMLVLGWIEHILPLPTAIPGIKLGLGNLVVVFALYRLGKRDALILSAAKVLISALLFSGFSGLLYSACGAAISFIVMALLLNISALSPIGVSSAGGAAHIVGQVSVAILLTSTVQIWRLCAPLLAVGTVTGAVNGLIAAMLLRRTSASAASK